MIRKKYFHQTNEHVEKSKHRKPKPKQRTNTKTNNQTNVNNKNSTSLLRVSGLSIASSFLLVALETAVYHLIFVQTVLLADVHWVMCCWSGGSRLLPLGTPSILDPREISYQIFCCCLESWRSCGRGSCRTNLSKLSIRSQMG